jgi:hypothetical protein
VGRIARFLKAGKYAERVGAGAPVLRRSGAEERDRSTADLRRSGLGKSPRKMLELLPAKRLAEEQAETETETSARLFGVTR